MKATLTTTADLERADTIISAVEQALAQHELQSYATAHHAVNGQAGTYYDSGGVVVASPSSVQSILRIPIGDTVVYVPCELVVGDAPTI
jgi:hypothetical protein